MSIWHHQGITLSELNLLRKDTISEVIGLEFVAIGDDFLKAKMPVDKRTKQPFGLLHGGASAVLAETLGSVASYLCIDGIQKNTVGIEINCNHLRSVRNGYVIGTARPFHIGGTTQVWEILIHDEKERLICVSRLTIMVVNK